MTNHSHKSNGGSLIGILLVAIGGLFLLDTLNILNFGSVFFFLSPLFLIIIGITKLKGQDRSTGILLIIFGSIFLLTTLDLLSWDSVWRFWPLILVWIGLSIILKSRKTNHVVQKITDDFVSIKPFFSSMERRIWSKNFKGGEITAIFASANLDLQEVEISPDGCQLNITVLFGSVDILLPPNTSLIISGTPIFGEIDDKSIGNPNQKGTSIECRCTIAFGALEIR